MKVPRPYYAPEPPLLHRPTPGHRKKGACVRPWLLMDAGGQAQVVEAGKHDVMRRTGLPARDLRILDPVLSYPSTVLGRERAIVVNLEHIKAIITAQEVLFQNSRDPLVTPFVKKLQEIILRQGFKSPQKEEGEGDDTNNGSSSNLYNSDQQPYPNSPAAEQDNSNKNTDTDTEQQGVQNARGLKLLPFEFVALEACLEAACSSLDNEARRLEQEAHPALDKLTSKISTLNLERVRQLKSRLVTITGRVQKVRDELEHLLDDDEDMAEMYLTEKLEQQHEEDNSSVSSVSELDDLPGEVVQPEEENNMDSAENIMKGEDNSMLSQIIGEPNAIRRDSCRTATSVHSANAKRLDVVELEMILEAYFVQIDGTLNKLSTLREYVDDTEDYINIMLDDKQNHLLQMGVMLTTATLVVSAFVALTGVFGMNIHIDLFSDDPKDQPMHMRQFLWTTGGGTIGCVIMYIAAIAWYKHKKLLQ
ncbi:magnesium transporter MRS2-3-like [Andrographis paniculata]|uniref:magnesium transporter MRS2-3-like n=1 Tax=Andrographis paniculata TaxID=175694 RepID=UPI0021E9349E|nr:magnesium transporter MRS2-3-like [Andrographis paniculata]